jgi:hypothetical protein
MKSKIFGIAILALSCATHAQEGYPLTGTWFGNWGDDDQVITLIMNWDGNAVEGIVNPGPDSTPLDLVQLDTSNWTLHAEMKLNAEGQAPLDFSIDGKLNDVLSSTRNITGTWKDSNGRTGPIQIARQAGP